MKGMFRTSLRGLAALLMLALLLLSLSGPAMADCGKCVGQKADSKCGKCEPAKKLKLYGDVRIRFEMDKDSDKTDGSQRDDRDRMRGRARFGFTYKQTGKFSFGARLRTGSAMSQQSPHATFGDSFMPKSINVDKLYLKRDCGHLWMWAGKNSFPFWKQNEMFWDDDVTPEGVALGAKLKANDATTFGVNLGKFFLGSSGLSNAWGDKSGFLGAQAVLNWKGESMGVTAAGGMFHFTADEADSTDEGDAAQVMAMDYGIMVFGAKLSLNNFAKPVALGVDFMSNGESYDEDTVARADQTSGYVASVNVGGTKNPGDWRLGFYYANIEEYAVVAPFAQDDWMRWGSSTQTRGSNFKGFEFRFAYAMAPKSNITLRYYSIEGIELRSTDADAVVETGSRIRLDFNTKF